jgi:hypothetical protein
MTKNEHFKIFRKSELAEEFLYLYEKKKMQIIAKLKLMRNKPIIA